MRSEGFTELVLIFFFMLGGIPLLIALVVTCNNSEMHYLNDKSVYDMSTSIDYVWDKDTNNDGIVDSQDGPALLVPINMSPLQLSYGESLILLVIQDDMGPDGNGTEPGDVMNIAWDFNMSKLGQSSTSSGVVGSDGAFLIPVTKGWAGKKYDEYRKACGLLATHASTATNGHGSKYPIPTEYNNVLCPYYFIYDYDNDAWTITREFINVFEVN